VDPRPDVAGSDRTEGRVLSVLGLGTDLAPVERLAELISRYGDRFLQRVFRDAELAGATATAALQADQLAEHWAAKEAFLKALGTGIRDIPYGDVEMVRGDGQPVLRLHGRARGALKRLGGDRTLLTTSRSAEYAVAMVIIEKS